MKDQNKQEILHEFKPFLWSLDLARMDLEKDKARIITNVLNFGTKKATDLLTKIYDEKEIKEIVQNPKPGEWSNKSLNYWSIIFNIKPKNIKNVLRHIG